MCLIHVTAGGGPAPALPARCSALARPHPGNMRRQEESRARRGMSPTRHVSWSRQQEQGEASLPMAIRTWDTLHCSRAAGASQLRCTVCPETIPVPGLCPGMTAPARAGGGLLPVWCRDERVRVRMPAHPGQGIAFHEALSAPSLIISRCSAKFLPANL